MSLETIDNPPAEADPSVPPPRWSLALFYTSHFLFTWNDRVWEFASVILLIAAYPQTLLPSSVFGLTCTAAAIVFSPAVGRWFDATARLRSVRTAVCAQRIAVGAGCICLWAMVARGLDTGAKDGLFAAVIVFGCVAKLAFVGKTVGIERDWVLLHVPVKKKWLTAGYCDKSVSECRFEQWGLWKNGLMSRYECHDAKNRFIL